MDKIKIAQLAKEMTSKEDLLRLLNLLKRDEMQTDGLGDKFHPFSMKLLNYYCNPNNVFHRYKEFKIKKKSGGLRQITAPRNKSFILLLKYVNEILKAVYTPSAYAFGFAEGRSVVDNAAMHTGMNYVFNIDIKDFFPSIEQPRIWKRFQLKPLEFPKEIASILAGLCSMRGEKNEKGNYRYILPQGAPTSPIITNMICDILDRRLAGLAKRFGLNYSRYADDITFSSMHNVYCPNGDFRKELKRIIEGQGLKINEAKTRLQKVGGRQEVTGLIVNNKVNVSRNYIRDIRNTLYIWDRYGYATAMCKFYPKYKEDKGHVKKGCPNLTNVIFGKLMYLKMVRGQDDTVYQQLNLKFTVLLESLSDPDKTTSHGITYIETCSVIDFEKRNDTEIIFASSKDSDNIKKTHRYAYFISGDKKHLISVHKSVQQEDVMKKELLAISYCKDRKGKMFWLLHETDKITVPPSKPVDIDELNNELEALLN